MNVTVHTYDPATEKVVPRDAVIIRDWLPGPNHRESLLGLLRDNHWSHLADQIEAQTKPPRIPEPGMYGVVSARVGAGGPWTLTRSEYGWVCLDVGTVHDWDSLTNPTLVRDGIEGGAS